jgi:hypothetical protein
MSPSRATPVTPSEAIACDHRSPVEPLVAFDFDAFLTDLCAVPSLDIPELTDDTLILFNGRMCLFGSLMRADKRTVEWNPIGECYIGGYGY